MICGSRLVTATMIVLAALLLPPWGQALGHGTGVSSAGKNPSLQKYRITNFKVGGDFTLTDQFGEQVPLTRFRGKVVMLSFGFTHCPDVCPATVSTMSAVLNKLGERASFARMIFVTVDPERDTPPILKKYLAYFHKDIIGLTGSLEEVEDMANQYAAPFRKTKSGSAVDYLVSHASFYFLINKQGKVSYIVPHDAGAIMLAKGVAKLLD